MTKTLLIITTLIFSLVPTSYGSFQNNDEKARGKLVGEIQQLFRESHSDSNTLSEEIGMNFPTSPEQFDKMSNNQLRALKKALIPVVKDVNRKIKIISEIRGLLARTDSMDLAALAAKIGVDGEDLKSIYSPSYIDQTPLNKMRQVKKALQEYIEREEE